MEQKQDKKHENDPMETPLIYTNTDKIPSKIDFPLPFPAMISLLVFYLRPIMTRREFLLSKDVESAIQTTHPKPTCATAQNRKTTQQVFRL